MNQHSYKIDQYNESELYPWKVKDYSFLPIILYRYEDKRSYNDRAEIILLTYKVLRETPKGYWYLDCTKERWISKTGKRKRCHLTKEEAWNSFVIRKNRQLEHIDQYKLHIKSVLREIDKAQEAIDGNSLEYC